MSRSKPTVALALALALVVSSRSGFAQAEDEAPPPPLPDATEEPDQKEASPESEPAEDDDIEPLPELQEGPQEEPEPPTVEPAPESAPETALEPREAPSEVRPVARTLPDWRLAVGYRLTVIGSPGFDPFATNDALSQATISLGRVVHRDEALSVASVLTFDVGGRDATARGESTNLSALSFALGPEGRYELVPWARLHLRPSFVVSRLLTSIDESSSQAILHANDWLFGFEAVAGGSLDLGMLSEAGDVRASLIAEAGYAWTTAGSLRFQPSEDDGTAPLRSAPLDLGELALRGATFRIAAALTF